MPDGERASGLGMGISLVMKPGYRVQNMRGKLKIKKEN